MPGRELGQQLRGQRRQQMCGIADHAPVDQAVDGFDRREEHEALFQRRRIQGPVRTHQGVRQTVCEPRAPQVTADVVDARTQALQVVVLSGRQIENEHVDGTVVLREPRRHLDREKEAGQADELQASFDAVVIGERDERHAAATTEVVLLPRIGVAFRRLEILREPLPGGEGCRGMQMEVAARRRESHVEAMLIKG